jgi:UV DNA damage endonuclease
VIRLGLCCIFHDEPIKFRTTTATSLQKRPRREAEERLAQLCNDNAAALLAALEYCARNGIGCFRVNSQILPLKTHPDQGYDLAALPGGPHIVKRFEACGQFARSAGLRTMFHPDQFVVLNSPRPEVVEQSIRELEYQAQVSEWIGADVINIHCGGAYGDKRAALERFAANLDRLSAPVRQRLTVENDDKIYLPADLLPVCRAVGLPMVYDIHHHRVNRDQLSEEEATREAMTTWNREPVFHLSSPLAGWSGPPPHRHHDYIDLDDFPEFWLGLDVTVEVEAKAKELAVLKLARQLQNL